MNYFKCGSDIFPFSEASPKEAYQKAKLTGLPISIFRVTVKAGVWDRVSVIGHRNLTEIMEDLNRCRSGKTKEALHMELDALEARYIEAGRTFMPLKVAA